MSKELIETALSCYINNRDWFGMSNAIEVSGNLITCSLCLQLYMYSQVFLKVNTISR